MPRRLAPALLLVGLLAACGGMRAAAPAASAASPAVSSGSPSASASASVSPSGPATPTAGETAAAFWARRGVTPAPPAGFLDDFAALRLPSPSPYVRAAVRELSGETYAIDHLRLDLVNAGVLGVAGLSGDRASLLQASAVGLSSTTTTLQAVLAATVLTVPAKDTAVGSQVVALRLRYGPFVGHFPNGTSKSLPGGTESLALAGRLVTTPLLGTFFYVTSEVDCSSAVAGSVSATACTALAKV